MTRFKVDIWLAFLCFGVVLEQTAQAALCDPSATFPNTWGDWSSWGSCSATGCDTQGFKTRNADQCYVGKGSRPASSIAQCPPKAHPLFKACSQQQQPCKSPACEDYKWTYRIDYTECRGARACSTQATGKAIGTCCADVNVDSGEECENAVNPQSSCQGYNTRRAVDVPCLVESPCGQANINTATFDPTKCTNDIAQAEFVNGLGRLLGLLPGQVKITSTEGCSRRRQTGGGEVEWQFISPCGLKAQQLYEAQLEAGNNPITAYLAFTDVVRATVETQSGEQVVSRNIPSGGSSEPESDPASGSGGEQEDEDEPQMPEVQPPLPPLPQIPDQPAIVATWSAWGGWSACTATCGGGQRIRQRVCVGGTSCPGPATDTGSCGNVACPATPTWSAWGPWSGCSGTCGEGLRTRSRECPAFDDSSCGFGPATQTESCRNPNPCETAQWSSWGPWGPCSETCGEGQQARTRVCTGATSSSTCPGSDTDTRSCNQGTCPPEKCAWEWVAGSTCSVPGSATCGTGTRAYVCNIIRQPPGSTCCAGSPPSPEPCEVPCPDNWSACDQQPVNPNSCQGTRYNLGVGTWSDWTCECTPTCVEVRTCAVRECGPSTGCSSGGAQQQGSTCSPLLQAQRPSSSNSNNRRPSGSQENTQQTD